MRQYCSGFSASAMVHELALELELLLKVISEPPVPRGARDDALSLSLLFPLQLQQEAAFSVPFPSAVTMGTLFFFKLLLFFFYTGESLPFLSAQRMIFLTLFSI